MCAWLCTHDTITPCIYSRRKRRYRWPPRHPSYHTLLQYFTFKQRSRKLRNLPLVSLSSLPCSLPRVSIFHGRWSPHSIRAESVPQTINNPAPLAVSTLFWPCPISRGPCRSLFWYIAESPFVITESILPCGGMELLYMSGSSCRTDKSELEIYNTVHGWL